MKTLLKHALACSLPFLIPFIAAGQIVANFTDGMTSEEVDGYPGQAGDGWITSWTTFTQSDTTSTPTVINTSPLLASSGNYLSTTVTKPTGGNARAGVSRSYGATDLIALDAAHSISFLYRLDATDGSWHDANLFYIMDGPVDLPGSTTTWSIAGIRDDGIFQWAFSSGNGYAASGIPSSPLVPDLRLIFGHVYTFTVSVDPANQRFRVFVENLSYVEDETPGIASFLTPWTDFEADVDAVSGNLSFGSRMIGGTDRFRTFSIDEIAIIPEPGAVALIGGLAALGALLFFRRP